MGLGQYRMEFFETFLILRTRVFDKLGLCCSQPLAEAESAEYRAFRFSLDEKSICYRQSKITPTKTGQFVTLWKREGLGPILPLDSRDELDFVFVTAVSSKQMGFFVFPKSVLVQRGVISLNGKGGKRAVRVYPPWDKTENSQAMKSQKWQLEFFVEIPRDTAIDLQKFTGLFLA